MARFLTVINLKRFYKEQPNLQHQFNCSWTLTDKQQNFQVKQGNRR